MKKEIATKWVEALRSGKYKQGRRTLRTYDGKFCCLGVLCEVSGLGKWKQDSDYKFEYIVGLKGRSNFLPSPVYLWADLKGGNPAIEAEGCSTYLANLNDEEKNDFGQIADLIEKQWETL